MARARGADGRWLAGQDAAPAAAPAPEHDYLVIYEEDADDGLPSDDKLVLDIESPKTTQHGKLDVKQKLDLELSNRANVMGKSGFAVSCIGALVGFILLAFVAINYPANFYDGTTGALLASAIRPTLLVAVLTLVLLIVGTIMTHYGRRIQARGNLSQVRIVEKTSQPRARLE